MKNWKTWQKWALYIVVAIVVYYLIIKFWPKKYKNVNGTPCKSTVGGVVGVVNGTWQNDVCVTIRESTNGGIKYNF